jgi:hypothetical protein
VAARLGHGFVAGFLATLLFHQSGIALLHRVGLFSGPALIAAGTGGPGGILGRGVGHRVRTCRRGDRARSGRLLAGRRPVRRSRPELVVLPLKGLPVGYGFRFPAALAVAIANGLWGLGTAVFASLRPSDR